MESKFSNGSWDVAWKKWACSGFLEEFSLSSKLGNIFLEEIHPDGEKDIDKIQLWIEFPKYIIFQTPRGQLKC